MVVGGATLKKHWEAGEGPDTPRGMIAKGPWDAVVIQEIFCARREEFEPYAALLDEAIRAAGSASICQTRTARKSPAFRPARPSDQCHEAPAWCHTICLGR